MTFLVTPEMSIKIGEKDYTLSGSMECLKKLQHHFKKDILEVLSDMPKMRFDEQAKIIEIAIDDFGTKPPAIETIETWIVDEVGIAPIRNVIQGWLLVITSPKKEREVQQKIVGEFLKTQGL